MACTLAEWMSVAFVVMSQVSVGNYVIIDRLGKGSYGDVFKAVHRISGQLYAIKRFHRKTSRHGSLAREIQILKRLQHDNILAIRDMGQDYLVYDLMQHDLEHVIRKYRSSLTPPQIKSYMRQLLSGLKHCHDRKILHRDIKPANILIAMDSTLKIADFGLSRFLYRRSRKADVEGNNCSSKSAKMTTKIGTYRYRPPELFLGETRYGPEYDCWAVGCIFGEMIVGSPLFAGNSEHDIVGRIFLLWGTPDEVSWPQVKRLPLYHVFRPVRAFRNRIRDMFSGIRDGHALDLLEALLALNPARRISLDEALQMEYFNLSAHDIDHDIQATVNSLSFYTSLMDVDPVLQQQQYLFINNNQNLWPSTPPDSKNSLAKSMQVEEPNNNNSPYQSFVMASLKPTVSPPAAAAKSLEVEQQGYYCVQNSNKSPTLHKIFNNNNNNHDAVMKIETSRAAAESVISASPTDSASFSPTSGPSPMETKYKMPAAAADIGVSPTPIPMEMEIILPQMYNNNNNKMMMIEAPSRSMEYEQVCLRYPPSSSSSSYLWSSSPSIAKPMIMG